MLKRFIAYYRPHLPLFAADMAASLLIALLGMVYPVMTNRMLNDYIPHSSYRAMAVFHSSTTYITELFNVVILLAGGLFLYGGRINFGEYSTFIVSVNLFINPVRTLIEFTEQWQNGATGFRRFIEIMDVPGENLFLGTILPILIMGLLMFIMLIFLNGRASSAGAGVAGNFTKSRAQVSDPKKNPIRFKDVAGLEEERKKKL